MVMQLCDKFNVSVQSILASYREYVVDPWETPTILEEVLTQEKMNTIPISSSEAERGLSKMNIICTDTRTRLAVDNICSLMFISINGHLRTYGIQAKLSPSGYCSIAQPKILKAGN